MDIMAPQRPPTQHPSIVRALGVGIGRSCHPRWIQRHHGMDVVGAAPQISDPIGTCCVLDSRGAHRQGHADFCRPCRWPWAENGKPRLVAGQVPKFFMRVRCDLRLLGPGWQGRSDRKHLPGMLSAIGFRVSTGRLLSPVPRITASSCRQLKTFLKNLLLGDRPPQSRVAGHGRWNPRAGTPQHHIREARKAAVAVLCIRIHMTL